MMQKQTFYNCLHCRETNYIGIHTALICDYYKTCSEYLVLTMKLN